MLSRTPLRAMLLIAIGALATLGACSDGSDELTGPAIPSLSEQAAGNGVATVAEGPLNAGCNCAVWSCASNVCGYDTANHLGACCVECTADQSIPSSPKPSCGGGGGGPPHACSEATPGSCQFGWPGNVDDSCHASCTCCYHLDGHGPD